MVEIVFNKTLWEIKPKDRDKQIKDFYPPSQIIAFTEYSGQFCISVRDVQRALSSPQHII